MQELASNDFDLSNTRAVVELTTAKDTP